MHRKLYFVQDDLSEEQNSQRNQYRDLVMEFKEHEDESTRPKVRMNKTGIFVNNELVKQHVQPPSCADILRLTKQEKDNVKAIKLTKSLDHVEKGSDFYVHATAVSSLEEVRKAYLILRIKYADAIRHFMWVPFGSSCQCKESRGY